MRLFHRRGLPQPAFLPMSKPEVTTLGWDELDFLLVSGDAYVDHPSFGMALLGRLLVAHGFRTGIITQPAWTDHTDLLAMGRPRLGVGISAGAIDSMLAHYTAFRKKRSDDAYTPGGKAGARPNRACIVYANLARRAFPGLPVILGGIEASLRRITHYDFWTDSLRRSILLDAKADAVVYGMGERALIEIAERLDAGHDLLGIAGTVVAAAGEVEITLPSHEEMQEDSKQLMRGTLLLEQQVHDGSARAIQYVGGRPILIAPPAQALTTEELDCLYALPFTRSAHPAYAARIPAEEMIRDSITSHRGCGGGCSFCTLALHQGRRIASRSRRSILDEALSMTAQPHFKGHISDIGGPSANMWQAECSSTRTCKRTSCMTPTVCPHFHVDQRAHLDLLRAVRNCSGVKSVRVASGVRFDLALQDTATAGGYLREFVGGQLKIAPEHVCDHILKLMRKPSNHVFERFLDLFARESRHAGKEQYVVPYLMSAFPGTTDQDMRELALWLARRNWKPRQVQCFIPIPGAVATAMFHAGITPDGRPIHVAKTDEERLRQHGILVAAADASPRHNLRQRPQRPAKTAGADHASSQQKSPTRRR